MRTSMAMAVRSWWGEFGVPGSGAAGGGAPGAPGRLGVPKSAGVGGAGTDRAGEPAQVDVQARHEAGAWGLIAHIDGTHGLIV
ncbi:hypothetical protein GCM10023235_29510 [Kitasatospora terrestris]|uniref:Uncharacterized protein n=1 Tax=Kitasatospora terrestris TaxID=258051 RepID=A0ABP9DL92_9ACTN